MSAENFLKFAKPFVDAVVAVMDTMVQTKLSTGKPKIRANNKAEGDISSAMGMSGKLITDGSEKPFRGMMVLSFPEDVYLKISSKMLMEEHTAITDEILDVGSEIANIIMGNAKGQLVEVGYHIDMSIPSVIQGKGHSITFPENTTVVQIPLESDLGTYYMELAYNEIL